MIEDQDTSNTTTQSTGDGSEDLPRPEGNSDDDEENSLLLSTICRLEIENLRMRKSINNFGFNLKDRILELEHEKGELIKAMKLLKPNVDPTKFSVCENSKYVNVDFAQFIDDSVEENNSSGNNLQPFASQPSLTDDDDNDIFSDVNTEKSIPHPDSVMEKEDSAQSQTLSTEAVSTTSGNEEGTEALPHRASRRSSLRRHSFLSQSKRGGGSKNWGDASRELEVGDTWKDSGDKKKNDTGNNGDQNGDDFFSMGNKRQSTEIALHSMRLSMQNPIMENNIQQNFLEFYMIGVERAILSGAKEPALSQQQPSEILNRFPAENTVFMDSIADFSFPRGAYLHLTRSIAYARSILKRKPTQYHILQFSDARGIPTFACCLTVTSVLRLHPSNAHHASVMTNLAPLLSRTHARHILVRFFRYVLRVSQDRREVVLNKYGVVVGYIRPRSNSVPMRHNMSPAKSPVKSPLSFQKFKNSFFDRLGGGNGDGNSSGNTRRGSLGNNYNNNNNNNNNKNNNNNVNININNNKDLADIGISNSKGEGRTALDLDVDSNADADLEARRLELSPQAGFARSISVSRDGRHHDSEDISETSDDDDSPVTDNSQSPPSTPKKKYSFDDASGKYSPSSKKRGKTKRNKPKKYTKDDAHYLISQRAYVLLSAKPLHTFLFRILEEIAQREENNLPGEVSELDKMQQMGTGKEEEEDIDKQKHNKDEAVVMMMESGVVNAARDKFLKYVQIHPLENPLHFSVRGIKNDTLYFNFPSYISHRIKIKINRIFMDEWANAVLFSLLTPSLIMYLLNSLILEKSIIVYGSNLSLVSSLTSAIVNLLRPFTWEGVYIPIIPANSIEILEAPVPFVVGTNIPFDLQIISPSANVLYVDQVLRCYMREDFSPEEMMHAKCLHRSLDVTVRMPINQNLRNRLDTIHNLLYRRLPPCFQTGTQLDATEAEIQIFNFQASYFFKHGGLSPEVRGAIKDISLFLVQHNAMFTGDISENDEGWRKYGVYDPFTDAYNFFPQWFLGHQTSILEFQTALSQTQLFYSYVDSVKGLYTEREFHRRFIADFLSYQYFLKKKKKTGKK